MAEKFSFGEGPCLSKPPLFFGMKYELWCIRMKFFVESINRKIWNVITNSYPMPISENVSSKREHLDCVAMNIIVSALDSNELLKVSECSSAKEMWNTLEEFHKNPRSALMDKEESSAESFSPKSRNEVHLMTKEESGSSQARRKRKQNKKEANLGLIAKEEDDASSVSSCPSLNAEIIVNFFKLLKKLIRKLISWPF